MYWKHIFFWYQKNSWVVSQHFITNYPQARNSLTKKSLLSWIVSLSWELEKVCLGLFQCLLRLPSRCLELWSLRRFEYLPPRQVSHKSVGRFIVFCWQEVSVHQKKGFFMALPSHLGTAWATDPRESRIKTDIAFYCLFPVTFWLHINVWDYSTHYLQLTATLWDTLGTTCHHENL